MSPPSYFFRYNNSIMARLRRLQLLVWCLVFPILGGSLPRASVWRCAHAAQLVTTFRASLSAMPCHMAGHGTMTCCRDMSRSTSRRAAFQTPPCKPTLAVAAPIPVARLTPAQTFAVGADASLVDRCFDAAALLPALLLAVSIPRGPPNILLAASCHASAHGLRAPPLS